MSRAAALASLPDFMAPDPQPEVCAFLVEVGIAFGLDTWAHRDKLIAFRRGVTFFTQPWPPVAEVLPDGAPA